MLKKVYTALDFRNEGTVKEKTLDALALHAKTPEDHHTLYPHMAI